MDYPNVPGMGCMIFQSPYSMRFCFRRTDWNLCAQIQAWAALAAVLGATILILGSVLCPAQDTWAPVWSLSTAPPHLQHQRHQHQLYHLYSPCQVGALVCECRLQYFQILCTFLLYPHSWILIQIPTAHSRPMQAHCILLVTELMMCSVPLFRNMIQSLISRNKCYVDTVFLFFLFIFFLISCDYKSGIFVFFLWCITRTVYTCIVSLCKETQCFRTVSLYESCIVEWMWLLELTCI